MGKGGGRMVLSGPFVFSKPYHIRVIVVIKLVIQVTLLLLRLDLIKILPPSRNDYGVYIYFY